MYDVLNEDDELVGIVEAEPYDYDAGPDDLQRILEDAETWTGMATGGDAPDDALTPPEETSPLPVETRVKRLNGVLRSISPYRLEERDSDQSEDAENDVVETAKSALRDALEKDKNPWKPYEGPSGGEGWEHRDTGEVRYQDERPAPDEGGGDDASLVSEPPDGFAEGWHEPREVDNVDEGQIVEVYGDEGYEPAVVTSTSENWVRVSTAYDNVGCKYEDNEEFVEGTPSFGSVITAVSGTEVDWEDDSSESVEMESVLEGHKTLPAGEELWSGVNDPVEVGDVVKVDRLNSDPNRTPASKAYEVKWVNDDMAVAKSLEGNSPVSVPADGSSAKEITGNREAITGVVDETALSKAETEGEKINRVVNDLSSEERVKAAQLVTQEPSPSDSRLPQFRGVLNALDQEELGSAFVSTVTSQIDAGVTRNIDISWFEGEVPGEYEDDAPSPLTTNEENLGYYTSRMDPETLESAVSTALEELPEDDSRRERVLRSATYYGKSAESRKKFIREYGDEMEDDPVLEMQVADDSEEFVDAFLEKWVSSEVSPASQHLVLATTNAGPNTSESVSAYTAGQQVFAEDSEGIPLAPIEPTEEMAGAVSELHERATEYHRENGTADLYRGVRHGVTTHGTVESWSESRKVAESFNGHTVLEAEVEPEDVLISEDMMGEDWPMPENLKRSEEEYILFGGAFNEEGED